ncbi:thioredoxin family protein [Listeria ilorinensis]|uniref:thioredoxin family protein n=1 Tax=Listeria ilorinensis TaxID=2867439 RepID=UPI001EF62A51|nr:thioredoxin family protein [Listeria ilorinensis]
MKKIIGMILCVCLGVLLTACSGQTSKQSDDAASETSQAAKAFLNTIGTADFKQKMADKETGFVYVGRPSCEDCQAFQPILQKELTEQGYSGKLAYYNTDKASEKNRDEMVDLLEGMSIDSVPTMVYLKDGKVVSTYAATDSQKNLAKWMDQQAD